LTQDKDIALAGEELDVFLSKYFSYYNTLNEEWRKVFRGRVIEFARSKWFVPQKGLKIDNRVKAIISASAVQLTLGLNNWKIGYFDTILLFPTEFTNAMNGLKLKGETNLNGFVSFSWKNFIDGYRIPNDNLNLGLHEFTHALRFNSIRGHESDEFFNSYFPKWFAFANREFFKLKKGKPSIFRRYGGANINEFLSVVIEHFFESPKEFQAELPLFYSATAIMLNQSTDGKTTRVNIRNAEIEVHKKLFRVSDIPVDRSRFIPVGALICFAIALCSAFGAGIFSFPSLFMFILSFLAFLRADYFYSYYMVKDDMIFLSKGFLIFKDHESLEISLPQLVTSEFLNLDNNENYLVLNYFDEDGFYEETVPHTLSNETALRFESELKKAFVWVK
jgi:MtfA peptidase